MSTISKLDPMIRRARSERKETRRAYEKLAGSNFAGQVAELAYIAMKRLAKDPTRTGKTKQNIADRMDKKIVNQFEVSQSPNPAQPD